MRLNTSTLLPLLAATGIHASSSLNTPISASALPTTTSASTATTTATNSPASSPSLVPYWSPLTTITKTLGAHPSSSPVQDYQQGREAGLEAQDEQPDRPRLDLREVVTGAAAAAATDPTQISPITTYGMNEMVNGVAQQVQVVYTQLFSAVPDQGEAPGIGSIGLGTIVGTIGVVKTNHKRDVEDVMTMAAPVPEMMEPQKRNEDVVVAPQEQQKQVEKRSNENVAGKVLDASSTAGSALALLVAITAMIVV